MGQFLLRPGSTWAKFDLGHFLKVCALLYMCVVVVVGVVVVVLLLLLLVLVVVVLVQ